jgi:hypothetical protein
LGAKDRLRKSSLLAESLTDKLVDVLSWLLDLRAGLAEQAIETLLATPKPRFSVSPRKVDRRFLSAFIALRVIVIIHRGQPPFDIPQPSYIAQITMPKAPARIPMKIIHSNIDISIPSWFHLFYS